MAAAQYDFRGRCLITVSDVEDELEKQAKRADALDLRVQVLTERVKALCDVIEVIKISGPIGFYVSKRLVAVIQGKLKALREVLK